MKKIININLSGRVIPIEDSAYEKLQVYIETLRRHFINEEGRDEIINDIESRIAELMSEKIRKGADSVTEADVDEIISSMGRPEDFEAAESETISSGSRSQNNTSSEQSYAQQPYRKSRGRLYRDSSDKILGGVCSGLANYLDIDPAVLRIIIALFAFTGTGILLYIILWIVLPAKDLNDYTGKRLFRNPDDKVIAGVAGGLAAYFKTPAWVIRLIFAAPLFLNIVFGTFNGFFFAFHRHIFPNIFIAPFTGTFILVYIILWMVLPEAKSTFEKMEMRGEKVDVNTIRQNVKEEMDQMKDKMKNWGEEVKTSAQNLGEKAKEFASTKGKAFVGEVAETTRPVRRGLGHIIGVLFKAFFIFVAGCIALALFAALIAILFGGVAWWPINNFLWSSQLQRLMAWGTLLLFIAVPIIGFMTWLIRKIVHVRSRNHYLSWVFGGLWFIGLVCAIMFAVSIAKDIRVYERVSNDVPLTQPANGRLIVTVNEPQIHYSENIWWLHMDNNNGFDITEDTMKYNNVKLRIAKSDDSDYHARLFKYSVGSGTEDAQNRASRVKFNISSSDSLLNIGSGLMIDRQSKFRGQGVILEIQVPVGKKIRFDESIEDAYNPWIVRKYSRSYARWGHRYETDWDFDEFFNWDTKVDYVMGKDGELFNPEKPVIKENETEGSYKYNQPKNKKQQLRDELKKIEEQEKKDSLKNIKESNQKKSADGPTENSETMVYTSVLPFTTLFN